MNKRRFRNLLLAAALLFANTAILLWLQANPAPTAWASPPAQDAPNAPDAPAAPEALEAVDAIPNSFSYQGVLRDASGELLDNVQVNLTIALYTAMAGGTPEHSQDFTGVFVRDGFFNVAVDLPNTDIVANDALYVGVTVQGDSELVPRQKVHPVPWALRAQTADTAGLAVWALVAGTSSALDSGGTAPLISGDVAMSGDVAISGEMTVQSPVNRGGNVTLEPRHINRYVVTTPRTGAFPRVVTLDNTIVNEYCMDLDGCTFTMGYIEHAREMLLTIPVFDNVHFSIGRAGNRAWYATNGEAGYDTNGTTEYVANWSNSCILSDHDNHYSGAVDTEQGFTLLRYHDGGDCIVIIED